MPDWLILLIYLYGVTTTLIALLYLFTVIERSHRVHPYEMAIIKRITR